MKLSFVIPCYRSEKTIIPVLEEIQDKMRERSEYDYEVITVNDYSPDHVLDVLTAYADTHSFLKVVDLTRNFGQHAAMMAGLSYTSGDWIVFLDDDGQCPMDHLWELLAPLYEGYDVSLAKYKFEERKESFFRVLGSRLNDAMVCSLLDKPKDLTVSNFIAMRSSLMAVNLFIGGMIMIMLGICGEYIGRIYISLNSSPQYVIRDTYHLDRHPLRGSETAYLDKE